MLPIPSPAEATERLTRIRDALLVAWRPPGTSGAETDTANLLRLPDEFFVMLNGLDARYGRTGALPDDDATRLGDGGLLVLTELITVGQSLGASAPTSELNRLAVTVGDWIVRHDGRILTLAPVVNGLALIANELRDAQTLEELTLLMTGIVDAVAPDIAADRDTTDDGRPWRVLHLNRAIVATRSHNTELMSRVFDDLIQRLPADASEFFREGARQMEVVNYPPKVRDVINRYFHALTQHRLH